MSNVSLSFYVSKDNADYIKSQVEKKGVKGYNKSNWLDELLDHLRNKSQKQPVKEEGDQPKQTRFTPPTLKEASQYFKERGCLAESEVEKFIDFYEMKGWMVGKNKMKDWKAAVRNWLKDKSFNSTNRGLNQIGTNFDKPEGW